MAQLSIVQLPSSKRRILGLVLIMGFGSFDCLASVGIDCSQASEGQELAICQDETLRAADVQMATLYDKLLPSKPEIAAEQATWATEIRSPCTNNECLANVYLDRISFLEDEIKLIPATATPPPPPVPATFETSFDCDRIHLPVERLICVDETLAEADVRLASLLSQLNQSDPSTASAQARWIHSTRNKCLDTDCLSGAYLDRISDVEGQIKAKTDEASQAAISLSAADSSESSKFSEESTATKNDRSIFTAILGGLAIVIIVLVTYLLPSTIAFSRGHQHRWAILIANVFLGVTGIGWVILLAMALGLIGGGAAVALSAFSRSTSRNN